MKSISMGFLLLAAIAPWTGSVNAQTRVTYDLWWNTINGGGDMWTVGGIYELSGTIGQPDAGVVMTGGVYELTGGFWAAPAAAPVITGDINCDGTYGYLSFGDINPFVLYLSNFPVWQATYPGCDPRVGDLNCDGTYGALSFGDINPFVQYLSDFSSWQASYPGCLYQSLDVNADVRADDGLLGEIDSDPQSLIAPAPASRN
jgi:hypothetical protein